MMSQAAAASAPSTTSETTTSMTTRRPSVCRVSLSGMATMSTRPTVGASWTSTRNPADWPPAVDFAEKTLSPPLVRLGRGSGRTGVGWSC